MELRTAQLQGMLKADRASLETETKNVALAKGRALLEKNVAEVFQKLQEKSNQRSVGAFENVLTGLLQDVLPGEGAIRLFTQYKSNDTYLDVMLEKPQGIEDIAEGNGGAVNNVVSAGLRYAALFRNKKSRRLIVLDEPDCWVEPDRIPFFMKVLSQVSKDMGAQTLLLTHHASQMLSGEMNVVKFTKNEDGSISAKPVGAVLTDWTDESQAGLRSIELINFRAHAHTIVPCFPGPTAYIGKNNLGKSTAINTALKVVAYGGSNDSVIRHGHDEAKVILRFENNIRIEWSRSKKRSPTVVYKLYQGDSLEPLKEGPPRKASEAPEWVTEVLGIHKVDDLDLQIGNQKDPVFLLNQSAPKRAQILSVGRESAHLKNFMKLYQGLKAKDNETIQSGELRIARLTAKLRYLEKVDAVPELLGKLSENLDKLRKLEAEKVSLSTTIEQIERLSKSVQKLNLQISILSKVQEPPALVDTTSLGNTIAKLERGLHFSQIKLPSEPADPPTLVSTDRLLEVGTKLARKAKVEKLLSLLPKSVPEIASALDTQSLNSAIISIEEKTKLVATIKNDLASTTTCLGNAETALAAAYDSAGGRCPLCDSIPQFMSHTH